MKIMQVLLVFMAISWSAQAWAGIEPKLPVPNINPLGPIVERDTPAIRHFNEAYISCTSAQLAADKKIEIDRDIDEYGDSLGHSIFAFVNGLMRSFWVRREQKMFDKCIHEYKVALRIDAKLVEAYINLGFAHFQRGYNQTLITGKRSDPDFLAAYYWFEKYVKYAPKGIVRQVLDEWLRQWVKGA